MFATADIELKQQEQSAIDVDERNRKLGVDMKFSETKHAYVLSFPWNFQEIVSGYEHDHRPISDTSYWGRFVFSNGRYEFNKLFREFH